MDRRVSEASLTMRGLCLLLCLALLPLGVAGAQDGELELLPADEAFVFSLVSRGTVLRLTARVAPGHYLYRDRLQVHSRTHGLELGAALMPAGESKDDPLFGRVQVYRETATIELAVTTAPVAGVPLSVAVTSQGCADVGVCYPPDTRLLTIDAPAASSGGDALGALSRLDQALGGGVTASLDNGPDFLPVDDAFGLSAAAIGEGAVAVSFRLAEGYYLYRSRMGFEAVAPDGAAAREALMPEGKLKVDDYFGEQQVYYDAVTARVAVDRAPPGMLLELKVAYQGCADAGLCYPPQERTLAVTMNGAGGAAGLMATPLLSETDQLARSLTSDALGWVLGTFFVAGLLLAFTPCVLPMIPILSAIIAGRGEGTSGRHGFVLSLVYVLAMSVAYTAAGIVAGLFGQNLQAVFQHPAVLVTFSLLFLALSLAMFGLYELQLPVSLQTRLTAVSHRQRGGSYVGVAVMGVLSALIVGPCVAAPLAAALIVIGSTGDPFRGGMALFALSLGMGVPLLAVGAFGPALLPRAGAWMSLVRQLFGVMLLAVAVYLMGRLLPDPITLALWAALALLTGGLLVVSGRRSETVPRPGALRLVAAAGAVVYAIVLALGAATGGSDPLRPLDALARGSHGALAFQRVKTVDELDRLITDATHTGRPVMLDFYADWCVSCQEMERDAFTDAAVRSALSDTLLLQADVTVYDDADRALLERFGLHGPPAILFFGRDGAERRALRVIGFMAAEDFAPHVARAGRS